MGLTYMLGQGSLTFLKPRANSGLQSKAKSYPFETNLLNNIVAQVTFNKKSDKIKIL